MAEKDDAPVTIYAVVSFAKGEGGDVNPGEALPAQSATAAKALARHLAAKHGAAVAFSRTYHPTTDVWDDGALLLRIGELPENWQDMLAA